MIATKQNHKFRGKVKDFKIFNFEVPKIFNFRKNRGGCL